MAGAMKPMATTSNPSSTITALMGCLPVRFIKIADAKLKLAAWVGVEATDGQVRRVTKSL
jgi:hypothetical protein